MKISYINNQFLPHESANTHIDDRGYHFADGVYEVVLALNNILIDWDLHMERLARSLREIRINYPLDGAILRALVSELIEKNKLQDAMVYIQLTRGVSARSHNFPVNDVPPVLAITVSAPVFPSDDEYKNGVSVITLPDIRWKRRDIKTISLLPNILAKQEAFEKGAVEAILIEDDGFITEGSSSNFFIIDKDGALKTHPADNRILNGITRLGILEVARTSGIKVSEEAFKLSEIMEAKGAFISSTTKHILPVTKVDGANIGGGVICAEIIQLMKLYKEYIEKQTGSK